MPTVFRNLRFGLGTELSQAMRAFHRRPAFAAVVVATLALGIGANTAIFSFVYAILIRPFPYADPERLVRVFSVSTKEGGRESGSSLLDVEDWARQSRSIEAIGAYTEFDADLRGDGPARAIRMSHLSAGALAALGVQPVLGRLIRPDEDRPGGDIFKAVIGHGLWQSHFSASPQVLGQTFRTSMGSFEVVGVMPPGFAFPDRADLWAPMESWYAIQVADRGVKRRNWRFYRVLGRLRAGTSLSAAEGELNRVAEALEQRYPKENAGIRVRLRFLRAVETGDIAPYLRMVAAAAGASLLICCFNVASLLLSRAVSTARDSAVRSALGASRLRVIRASLAETFVLAMAGGLAGVGLAFATVKALLRLLPVELPGWMRIEVDLPVLGFAVAASILATFLCGLAAAVFAARADLAVALKDSTRTTTGTGSRLRGVFVVSQVGLTLLLLIAAGLLTRSFLRLRNQETGFRASGLLVVRATNYRTGTRIEQAAALSQFHQTVLERLRALPGVVSAAGTNGLPYTRSTADRSRAPLRVRGTGENETKLQLPLSGSDVSPEYLETMGIPLLRGRTIDERDTKDAPMVVLVNERAARALWPDREAVGQELYWGIDDPSPDNPWCRVAGVVGNVRHLAGEADDGLELYYPYTQYPITNIYYVIRANGDPLALAASVRQAIKSVDRDAAIVFIKTLDGIIDESLWQRRLWSIMLTGFGALSLVLASIGLYGLLSHIVAQQTREIGVRMALGARPFNILTLVLGHGARLLAVGLALGLAGGLAAGRLLGSLVFGVKPTDQGNLLLACAVLAAVALVACYLPARRASALDPIRALRDE